MNELKFLGKPAPYMKNSILDEPVLMNERCEHLEGALKELKKFINDIDHLRPTVFRKKYGNEFMKFDGTSNEYIVHLIQETLGEQK